MGFVKEFKEFAIKGNVIDLAVGVIIGGAFGSITKSVIDDLIMPIVGMAGNADFSSYYVPLNDAVEQGMIAFSTANAGGVMPLAEAKKLGPVFAYGNFITVVLNFMILAFIVFLMIKGINRLKRKQEEAPAPEPEPTNEEKLLSEIRDLLKTK